MTAPDAPAAVQALAMGPGEAALAALGPLERALGGGGALAPHAAGTPSPIDAIVDTASAPEPPADLAVVVGTSGSSGPPKLAMLTAAALRASATSSAQRLGGGRWLLAVPAHHVAGIGVLVRSVLAGTTPVVMDLREGFTAAGFTAAANRLPDDADCLVSLVPTQLTRLLDDPAARRALTRFRAVLVGGAATGPELSARAEAAGVRVVRSYGMSETGGGCVYDGVPLAGTDVALEPDGRVRLAGPTLAAGYYGRPDLTAEAFTLDETGRRWFLSDDLGSLTDGVLSVTARVDDIIVTGGLKVDPEPLERAARTALPGVTDALAVGLADGHWGQVVTLVLVMAPGVAVPSVATVRAALREHVVAPALPRRVETMAAIPMRGVGKPDRRGVRMRLDM